MIRRLSLLSLRARLIILIFISVVPALFLLFYTTAEQRRLGESDTREETLDLAKLASNNIEQLVEGAHQVLLVLAELPAVRNRDSAACDAYFSDLLDRLSMYNNLLVSDPSGRVFCSALPMTEKVNVADRLWFQKAVKTRKFSVGGYMIGRISDKPVINAGFPVFDKLGRLKAVIGISVDLQWFNDQLSKLQLHKGTAVFLLDRDGTIIAHHPDPEKWIGRNMSETGIVKAVLNQKEGTLEISGLTGTTRIFSFAPIQGTDDGMYICMGISPEEAFAGVYKTFLNNLLGLFIIAFIASTAAWIGGDYFIMRRMKKLVKATDELASGDLTARVNISNPDEIGQLGAAFNKMASALEQSNSEQKQISAELQTSCSALLDEVTQRRATEAELKRSHEQLRNLASHLQSIREEERTRISRELHDELGQVLTALKMDLVWMSGKIPPENQALSDKIKSDLDIVDSTIQALKRICMELRPAMLDHFGLGAALQWQAKQFEGRSGIKCAVNLESEEMAVDKDLAAALYGIFREALTNVRRHARASEICVTLRQEKKCITLEICDNGIGISEENLSKTNSFGLLGMRERLYPWHGSVKIDGRPDQGTTVTVAIPLKEDISRVDGNGQDLNA
jgi:signal transduction histidine kinase